MTFLQLDAVTKDFQNGTRAVDSVDLSVDEGELMVLVGPSGCGKTTLLRMIAGLESTTSGRILLAGEDVTNLNPGDRDLAMVFQSYALYPHMSVRGNLSFGLRMNRLPKDEIEERVTEAARFLQLSELLNRRPAQLSGGQRQRVAMGRAMVRRPNAFLMDEPLSNLDAKLRVQMRGEVTRIQRELGITTVYVTHDQVEAMTMGDRVAVLDRGRVQQVATPTRLYDHPANLFVAGFLGSPAMSFLEADVEGDADGLALRFRSYRIALPAKVATDHPGLGRLAGKRIVVGVRAEDVAVESFGVTGDDVPANTLPGRVVQLEMLGAEAILYARVDASEVVVEQLDDLSEGTEPLTAVTGPATPARQAVLVAKSDRSAAGVTLGTRLALSLDAERLHLFDLDTGQSLGIGRDLERD